MDEAARLRVLPDAPPPAGDVGPDSAPDERRDEQELVDRCLAGDPEAAEKLVNSLTPLVYGIGLRLGAGAEDAEDLTQDVFLRAFRALPQFRGECSLRAWIASIAVNQSRTRIGKLVRFRSLFAKPAPVREDEDELDPIDLAADPREGPEEELLSSERRQRLEREIAALPEPYRLAVVLRDERGLAYDEIATVTGVPVGTVRSRLARGRTLLAKRLGTTLPGKRAAGGAS